MDWSGTSVLGGFLSFLVQTYLYYKPWSPDTDLPVDGDHHRMNLHINCPRQTGSARACRAPMMIEKKNRSCNDRKFAIPGALFAVRIA
jgi:hypothetical protein